MEKTEIIKNLKIVEFHNVEVVLAPNMRDGYYTNGSFENTGMLLCGMLRENESISDFLNRQPDRLLKKWSGTK